MSANNAQEGSFIIPSTDRIGLFRCGICWSVVSIVQVAVEDDKVLVRIICPVCGNMREWQVDRGS